MKLLKQILKNKQNRKTLIKEFQEIIWNDTNANNILSELAYDLDFYEPNKQWQKEDINYYGDDKLEEILKTTIQKLNEQLHEKQKITK